MILEEDHIEKDTIKYAKDLHAGVYQDTIIRLGFIMSQHEDQMSIENMFNLKMAQATICQLGLEKELEAIEKHIGGEDEV